jgi:hypothetical protein
LKRAIVAALAAFYALQASWALHAGFDALFPRVTALVTPDSCCASACGCPEEVVLRGDCCCGPAKKAVESRPVQASAFDVARCSGLELAMAQAVGLPAVASFPRFDPAPAVKSRLSLPESGVDHDVHRPPVDKVPL